MRVNVATARQIFEASLFAAFQDMAFVVHRDIVRATPIDTGRAKSSWNISPDQPDHTTTPLLADRVNPIGGAIIEKAAPGASPLTPGQAESVALQQQAHMPDRVRTIFISNALPYILNLENGSSRQAPAGMVFVNTHPGKIKALLVIALNARLP